jgi:hypothetical protein
MAETSSFHVRRLTAASRGENLGFQNHKNKKVWRHSGRFEAVTQDYIGQGKDAARSST